MRVGTRDSRLAMRQTEIFCDEMRKTNPDVRIDVVPMKAMGDLDQKTPLDSMPATGAFTRELDEAIVECRIDASVNSLKDVPTRMDPALEVVAVFERDADNDVILPCALEDLPPGSRVGTSSVRRSMMIANARPDLAILPLRGNIHTRLRKLDDGEYDAIVLAQAGLDRMGIERPMHPLDKSVFVPAPAQGAIAVECRSDDVEAKRVLSRLDHGATRVAVTVEREIMRLMGAGCSAPVGINASVEDDVIRIRAASFYDGDRPRRVDAMIPLDHSEDDLAAIADHLMGGREAVR